MRKIATIIVPKEYDACLGIHVTIHAHQTLPYRIIVNIKNSEERNIAIFNALL